MSEWIKISDKKPIAPCWVYRDNKAVDLFQNQSILNEATTSVFFKYSNFTHWKPAEVPQPPEPEQPDLNKAFLNWSSCQWRQHQNSVSLQDAYKAGFDKAVEIVHSCLDERNTISLQVAMFNLKQFRGDK